ncbi:MAG: phosphodiester glycosidase family protein [Muribaculaceae bacterium]|nr:phosphodiester glycosidase family protein [Muribaculaceae bacterium]
MKQLFLLTAISLGVISARAFEADLDGTKFNIDTIYCQVVGPGITRSHLSLSGGGRSFSVYTSTMRRSDGAEAGLVEPRVILGKDQCRTAESLTSMAKRHTGGDTQYLTGINGDFFITSSFASQHEFGNNILGYPNMACVIDGKIAAPDMIDITSRENALVIGSEGWWIDATDFRYRLLSNDGEIKVDATAVNYPRRDGEMVVYNSYMGATTNTAANGRELVLKMAEGAEWHINKSTKFIVDGDWIQGGNTAIPTDGLVISCGPNYKKEFIDGLKKGDIVKLKVVMGLPAHDGLKPDVKQLIGGDVRILNQGQITREAIRWINTPNAKYQRSLVGFSEDRDMMMFAAVDGSGLTYYESAALMKALGCHDALDLDGGGSTAIWSDKFGIYNSPRDGSERAIGNALYFTLKAPVDNEVASIRFADHRALLPRYASYTPVIFGYNKYGQLVDTDVHDFTLEAPEELGTVNGSILLASGEGTHALKARKGDMEAVVVVSIDDTFPAKSQFESLLMNTVKPVKLQLVAKVGTKEMPVAPQAFDWETSDASVAFVNDNYEVVGVADGVATVTGRCGDNTVSIAVTVEDPQTRYRSLLSPDLQWRGSGSGTKPVEITLDADGGLNYDFSVTSTRGTKATLRCDARLYSRPDQLKISYDLPGVEVSRVQVAIVPTGYRVVNLEFTDGIADISPEALGYAGVESIYPLTFQSVTFNISASTGNYHLSVPKLEAVYLDYTTGVADVAVDADNSPLNFAACGLDINVFNSSAPVELFTTSGRCVARGLGRVSAPCAGIYVLHCANGSAKVALSE